MWTGWGVFIFLYFFLVCPCCSGKPPSPKFKHASVFLWLRTYDEYNFNLLLSQAKISVESGYVGIDINSNGMESWCNMLLLWFRRNCSVSKAGSKSLYKSSHRKIIVAPFLPHERLEKVYHPRLEPLLYHLRHLCPKYDATVKTEITFMVNHLAGGKPPRAEVNLQMTLKYFSN